MLKLRNYIGWIVLLLVVAVVATYFVLGPVVGAHAATIHKMLPNFSWNS